jgi:alanine dehydrogenase
MLALNNVTLPFVLALPSRGFESAIAEDPHLAQGVNVYQGKIMREAVAREMRAA